MIAATIIKNSRFFMLLLLALIVVLALYFFREVILPFAVAAFLAYLIAPVVEKISSIQIRKRKIHRAISIAAVYSVALGMITLSGFYLIPKLSIEVNRLVHELPGILRNLEETVVAPMDESVNSWLAEFVSIPKIGNQTTDSDRAPSTQEANGIDAAENSSGVIEKLVEDYTYIVRRLDDDRFEVVPKKRNKNERPEIVKNFDFNRQISTVFGQFRGHFEDNFIEVLRQSRSYALAILGSFFSTFLDAIGLLG